jgi:pyruvate dehydrogenase E1 component beta subunit
MAPMATVVTYREHLSLEPLLLQVPGLRVLAPSNHLDYMNLLEQAALDPDPVVFFVPEKWMELEPAMQAIWEEQIGPKQAKVVRAGESISLVAYGKLTELALQVAAKLAEEEKSIEVIDLRSLSPIDFDTVIASVKKTGRLVVLQDSPRSYGVGAEIAARVSEAAIESLLAPIRRVAAFDAPNPGALESIVHPDAESLSHVLRNLTDF